MRSPRWHNRWCRRRGAPENWFRFRTRERPRAAWMEQSDSLSLDQERNSAYTQIGWPLLTCPDMLICEVTASSVEAREIKIAGKQLRCQVCDYTRFYRREAGLSSGASNVFGQEWAHSQATCFICEQCGYVHWFVRDRVAAMAAVACG